MNINRLQSLANKRVLLLQGPMGPFFKNLDHHLRAKGSQTVRICFNGGDRLFANDDNRVDYRGKPDGWRSFLTDFCAERKIQAMIVYGGCRFYHRVAKDVATASDIQFLVFEEGYLRPNFVTLEENGVNANSSLPRQASFYRQLKPGPPPQRKARPVKYPFHRWAIFSILYFASMRLWRHRYPHNRHHRNTRIGVEAFYGIRNGVRKLRFAWTERHFSKAITGSLSKNYYFVPLQVQYDFQISRHSPFRDMQDFIQTVMVSFAKHAPKNTRLVVKHHPMDRGRTLFYAFIAELAESLGISDRVHVIHDIHLPTCLKNAIATVTINSTVGIASLFHGTPTLALGEAFYDIEGLTCRGMPLDRFWSEYRPPDRQLFQKFRSYLIEKTQLEGSFYSGFLE